jgi:subtilase family serine protease
MPANATAEIIAVNPSGDWYKVRSTYGEGWISAAFVTVSGNVDSLPVDAGPPTPVPYTDTPVPTATPATNTNLVIVGTPVIDPHPLECGETASIEVTVRNDGSGAATSGGMIFVEDVRSSDGARQQSTEGVFPVLQPGQSHTAEMFLTVSTYFNEGHRIVITIDSNNQVPETNEGDNRFTSEYALAKGDC